MCETMICNLEIQIMLYFITQKGNVCPTNDIKKKYEHNRIAQGEFVFFGYVYNFLIAYNLFGLGSSQ